MKKNATKLNFQSGKIETYRNLGLFMFEENLKNEGKKALEIGSAEGWQLEIFNNRGWDIVGIEPNKDLAHVCRISRFNVINEYIEDVQLPKNYFSLIIATHVIEHVRNPHIFMQKVFKLLTHNGRLILETPFTVDYNIPEHLFFFSRKSLVKLLEDNHFVITKEFGYHDKFHNLDNFAIMVKKVNRSISDEPKGFISD